MGCELNALLEDVEGDVGFLLFGDERGAETDAGFAAAEDEEAALEGEFDDLVAHGTCRCAGFVVFDYLKSDHQAAAADFAYGGVFGNPWAKTLEHGSADSRGIFDTLALDDVHGGE